MKESLLNYWRQLNEREQLLVMIGGILLALFVLYFLVYRSLLNAVETKQQTLITARSTWAWMKQVEPVLVKKETVEVLNRSHLLSVLSTQLTETSFKQYPYHLEQAAAQQIQLTFAEVPYVSFMQWLNKLSTKYAFSIQQLDMSRTDKPGMIKLLLVIEVS